MSHALVSPVNNIAYIQHGISAVTHDFLYRQMHDGCVLAYDYTLNVHAVCACCMCMLHSMLHMHTVPDNHRSAKPTKFCTGASATARLVLHRRCLCIVHELLAGMGENRSMSMGLKP